MQFLLTGLVVTAEENCPRQETFLFRDLKRKIVAGTDNFCMHHHQQERLVSSFGPSPTRVEGSC